jgi:peptidoglycan hydrolase FlgJ
MLTSNNADVYTDFKGLAALKHQARKESPEALKETAKQFEAIFLNSVLKSMREAKLADGIMDNDQSQFYKEMYDQQLAVHLSGSPGVGLADLIVKQLSHEEPEASEKLELEDYLNRSAGSAKPVAGRRQAVDSTVSRPANSPDLVMDVNAIDEPDPAEMPLKNNPAVPINSVQDFVRQLQPFAEQAAQELGVESRVIMAQAALETGWGRSLIKNSNGSNSFNVFNIKADKSWQGKQAQVATLEFEDGIAKKVNAGFRTYSSFKESFQDYVSFIKSNPRYHNALKQVGNAERYMHELQRAGYATDPNYANKVISIYRGNTLADVEIDSVASLIDQQTG